LKDLGLQNGNKAKKRKTTNNSSNKSRDKILPQEVTVKADSPDGPLSITIPAQPTDSGTTLGHKLAARALIRDLEQKVSYLHDGSWPSDDVVKQVRATIVVLLSSLLNTNRHWPNRK